MAARRRSTGTWVLLGLTLAAVVVTVVAALRPAGFLGPQAGSHAQAVALVRVAACLLVVITVLLVPGLGLRGIRGDGDPMPLAFAPVPGFAGLVVTGLVVWWRPLGVDPVAVALVGIVVLLLTGLVLLLRRGALLLPGEGWVLALTALPLLAAVGRSLWSMGPDGELYGGMISRTLEFGDRPDSRISFHVVQVVTAGTSPVGPAAQALFSPYGFGDRGPLLGVAAAPVVLASGARPTMAVPEQPWSLLDPDGFMFYRLVAMALAVLVVPAAYAVARQVAGRAAGLLAAAAVATTPFVVHETYFTWPKLLAGAMCGLAAVQVLRQRPWYAGLFLAVAFLCHPLALLAVPTLLALALIDQWRLGGTTVRRLRGFAGQAAFVLGLPVVALLGWRFLNRHGGTRGNFLVYLVQSDAHPVSSLGAWLDGRFAALANTLVPLWLPYHDPHLPWINKVDGGSDGVVHFFFQYWNGVPFGLAIVFLPVLLWGLGRATRVLPWVVLLLVIAPFLVFWVYWGSFDSGLMREGLHPWVLAVLVVWALAMAPTIGRSGWPGRLVRLVLALRCVEVLLMMVVPTLHHHAGMMLAPGHAVGDLAAWVLMVGGCAALGVVAFVSTSPRWSPGLDQGEARQSMAEPSVPARLGSAHA